MWKLKMLRDDLNLASLRDSCLLLDDITFNLIFYQQMPIVVVYTRYSMAMASDMGRRNISMYNQDARCRGFLSPVETPFPTEQYKAAIWITTAHHNLFMSWGRSEMVTSVRRTAITIQSLNAVIWNTLECMCVPKCIWWQLRWFEFFDTFHNTRLMGQNYFVSCENYWKFKKGWISRYDSDFQLCLISILSKISDWSVHSVSYDFIRLGSLWWVPFTRRADRRSWDLLTAVRPVELTKWLEVCIPHIAKVSACDRLLW